MIPLATAQRVALSTAERPRKTSHSQSSASDCLLLLLLENSDPVKADTCAIDQVPQRDAPQRRCTRTGGGEITHDALQRQFSRTLLHLHPFFVHEHRGA